MPDISMCKNESCPLRGSCYRFMAEPNSWRQSYAGFTFSYVDENGAAIVKCPDFWPIGG